MPRIIVAAPPVPGEFTLLLQVAQGLTARRSARWVAVSSVPLALSSQDTTFLATVILSYFRDILRRVTET